MNIYCIQMSFYFIHMNLYFIQMNLLFIQQKFYLVINYPIWSLLIRALNSRTVNALVCWPMIPGSSPSLGKTPTLKTVIQLQGLQWPSFNCRDFSDLYEKLSCTITRESTRLLNCEIYQRRRVSTVADTELKLTIAHLIVRWMN